jgi:hypothetical protein
LIRFKDQRQGIRISKCDKIRYLICIGRCGGKEVNLIKIAIYNNSPQEQLQNFK